MIAEGKPECRRRRILREDRSQVGLMIFFEFLVMRNVTAIAIHFPTFRKITQRNPGIVLNDNATVLDEKVTHPGETVAVHQEGSGFEQTQPWRARGAPAKESAVSAG